MITQIACSVLLAGQGETLEAIERVCDKRSLRGATPRDIIEYLNSLAKRYEHNQHILDGIYTLRSYWIARQA